MLIVAKTNLPCQLVAGDLTYLPFQGSCFYMVTDRHVGANPHEVLRVLQSGGIFLTQQVGGRYCQSIFDAFGWGSNAEFWQREYASIGEIYWDVDGMVAVYLDAGCKIIRCEEADVEYEFLDEESLAFWLLNAPLPEHPDPDHHADIINSLPLKTNWHSELLVVRC